MLILTETLSEMLAEYSDVHPGHEAWYDIRTMVYVACRKSDNLMGRGDTIAIAHADLQSRIRDKELRGG